MRMDNNKPQDIFKESEVAGVGIPKKIHEKEAESGETFQSLKEKLSINGNIEYFTICALIGKYIVKKREKTGTTIEYFKMDVNKNKDEMNILNAIAVEEVDNPYILKDQKEMRIIWEEYAYSGFKKLNEWHKDKQVDIVEKLSSAIITAFEEKVET